VLPLCNESSVWIKDLNLQVRPLGHITEVVSVDADRTWERELTRSVTQRTPLRDEVALRIKPDDSLVFASSSSIESRWIARSQWRCRPEPCINASARSRLLQLLVSLHQFVVNFDEAFHWLGIFKIWKCHQCRRCIKCTVTIMGHGTGTGRATD